MRQQLINEKGYSDAELPSEETIRIKLNQMGYGMKRVKKVVHLYFTSSKVTSDFIVDCRTDFWNEARLRLPEVTTLVINQDNGPQSPSRRTQFMNRITHFVDYFGTAVQLTDYPP